MKSKDTLNILGVIFQYQKIRMFFLSEVIRVSKINLIKDDFVEFRVWKGRNIISETYFCKHNNR